MWRLHRDCLVLLIDWAEECCEKAKSSERKGRDLLQLDLATCVGKREFRRTGTSREWCGWSHWTPPLLSHRAVRASKAALRSRKARHWHWIQRTASRTERVRITRHWSGWFGTPLSPPRLLANARHIARRWGECSTSQCDGLC
jgi:hypothetical protein